MINIGGIYMALIKEFRFSYTHLLITLLLFSTSFTSYENALTITLVFLLIINVTCFTNEYLVIQYYRKNKEKKSNKGYANFIMLQTFLTLIMFLVFKFVIFS
ncbi:hypothetical protein E2636_00030 [Paenisporosarcina antarctica]|uniref:DUF4181 domain-containing protein n=1 Tax=Paenisporosarcina antarctica TaxID=417367 RepID=A0A4P6ZTV1_9BACL|nr:hypothetical protein E2636_00030 [Paenisporosarcina antarctica]